MGTVLEMTWARGLSLLAALALAGCGGSGEGQEGATQRASAVAGSVFRIVGGETVEARPAPAADFTPEIIAASPQDYRFIQVNALGLAEAARVIQRNGDEITLRFQSGPTAAFDGGVLVATHGFGDDLIVIDSQGVLPAIRAGGGSLVRRMETLDDQDQGASQSFACTITPAGTETVNLGVREASLRRFDENCRSEALVFDNIYWVDGSGEVAASRQYVSPTVAYLRSNRL